MLLVLKTFQSFNKKSENLWADGAFRLWLEYIGVIIEISLQKIVNLRRPIFKLVRLSLARNSFNKKIGISCNSLSISRKIFTTYNLYFIRFPGKSEQDLWPFCLSNNMFDVHISCSERHSAKKTVQRNIGSSEQMINSSSALV